MKPFAFLFFIFISISSIAQVLNQSQLSIDQIMKGDDFVGYLPTNIEWADNSETIYFSWNPNKDTIRSTYGVDIHSKVIKKLSFEELKQKPNDGDFSKDYKWKVYEKEGDLFLMDNSTFSSMIITNTLARESNPQFSGDQKSIIYQQDINFFKWDIDSGSTTQLTDFKTEKRKKRTYIKPAGSMAGR